MLDKSKIKKQIRINNRVFFPDYLSVDEVFCGLVGKTAGKGARVLDFGSGRDDVIKDFLSEDVELYSIDTDEMGIASNPNTRKFVTDGNNLPFENGMFDIICFKYVFEHLEDPDQILAECNRCLKPGGMIMFLCPAAYSYMSLLSRVTPFYLHKILTKLATNREHCDTFPAFYRLNMPNRITYAMKKRGFIKVRLDSYVGSPSYWEFSPVFHTLFCIFHKLIEMLPFRTFDITLIGIFKKIDITITEAI